MALWQVATGAAEGGKREREGASNGWKVQENSKGAPPRSLSLVLSLIRDEKREPDLSQGRKIKSGSQRNECFRPGLTFCS